MPHISQLKKSNFLTKEDCGRGILVTIGKCVEENVAKEGAAPEMKWCLYFDEQEKPMVLNSTNAQLIAHITGAEETDGWKGWKVVLYADPTITYAGKLVGGIRVRAQRQPPQSPPRNPPPPARNPPPRPPAPPAAPPPPPDWENAQNYGASPYDEDVPF